MEIIKVNDEDYVVGVDLSNTETLDMPKMSQIREKIIELTDRRTRLEYMLSNTDSELIKVNSDIHKLQTEAHSLLNNYIYNR